MYHETAPDEWICIHWETSHKINVHPIQAKHRYDLNVCSGLEQLINAKWSENSTSKQSISLRTDTCMVHTDLWEHITKNSTCQQYAYRN